MRNLDQSFFCCDMMFDSAGPLLNRLKNDEDTEEKLNHLTNIIKKNVSSCIFHSSYDQMRHATSPTMRVERVDLRHRLPFSFPHYDNVCEIEEEVESLIVDERNLFDRIKLFFITNFKSLLQPDQLKIIGYLEGTISLDEIGLTRENAATQLRLVKILDLALLWQTRISRSRIVHQQSTYEIRTRILELLSPEIQTTEAYTLTLDPQKIRNRDYLKEASHWMPERIRFYCTTLIPQEYIRMIALSQRLKDPHPRVYALRGGTASGKTTVAIQLFGRALDEQGELSGCINPDHMKCVVKSKTSFKQILTNFQVHEEVARGPLAHYEQAVLSMPKYSIMIDKRCSSLEDFMATVIHPTKSRKGHATVIDLDVPLEESMLRVLTTRDPRGKSACPHPSAIQEAFQEVRSSRSGIIKHIKKGEIVDRYVLFHMDESRHLYLVAEKIGPLFQIYSVKKLKRCLTALEEDKILDKTHQIVEVQPWKGLSLERALRAHALAIPPSIARKEMEKERMILEKFGRIVIQPFTDAWLFDYPQVKEHLDSEHLLHIRGTDADGVGLHWQTNKFAWKLNPRFNPEAGGGFQMKMGYFIISPSHIETFRSPSLSENILKELEVQSSTGNVLGYRFFVHPEAYLHFQTLLEEGIPFIQSEHSEFMGTPTSSYRSWAVRRIIEDKDGISPQMGSVPFIVKLGVGQSNDASRLLPRSEVERSLSTQRHFDRLPVYSDLTIFKETFGVVLRGIHNYPPPIGICDVAPTDSGMIVREFPEALLMGTSKIYSFSALMSVERGKYPGICQIEKSDHHGLPLIYEIIKIAIQKNVVKSTNEFIQRFLISDILKALEPLVFDEGLSIALHGQNLCMVFNRDYLPIGIAIRDHGDIHKIKRYLETYTWFYRYHIFIKLLNVLTFSKSEKFPFVPGLPIQNGSDKQLKERCLNRYLRGMMDPRNETVMHVFKMVSLSFQDYRSLVQMLDERYLSMLSRYFDLTGMRNLITNGAFKSAEVGSHGERELIKLNRRIFKNRKATFFLIK